MGATRFSLKQISHKLSPTHIFLKKVLANLTLPSPPFIEKLYSGKYFWGNLILPISGKTHSAYNVQKKHYIYVH